MLVLASASPRRRELLTQAGYSFIVHPAHIPEDPYPNEDPTAYVTRLAREKAEAVFRELTQAPETLASGSVLYQGTTSVVSENAQTELGALAPAGIPSESSNPMARNRLSPGRPVPTLQVLGADTTVVLDSHILGKPADSADAARMLRLLSGRVHRVITGVALVSAQATQAVAESTSVQFLTLSDQEIAAYIATGEPMDKAGAYAIQGRAARWIPRIEGCYFNVVGLPIALVSTLLQTCQPF
jgi:septum formation protein